jgi:hypothetical protein
MNVILWRQPCCTLVSFPGKALLYLNRYGARERISLPSLPRALQSGKSFSSSARTWILFNRRERKDFRRERKAFTPKFKFVKLMENS